MLGDTVREGDPSKLSRYSGDNCSVHLLLLHMLYSTVSASYALFDRLCCCRLCKDSPPPPFIVYLAHDFYSTVSDAAAAAAFERRTRQANTPLCRRCLVAATAVLPGQSAA
jgi:hypothetical protein